jgi:hypothetical protein
MLRKAGLLIGAIIQRRLVILKVSLLLQNDFRLLELLQGPWKWGSTVSLLVTINELLLVGIYLVVVI